MNPPVVVGADLSLTSTGLAGPDWTARLRSTGSKADTLAQRRDRIRRLTDRILDRIGLPALVVVEAPAYSRNVGSSHDRAGLWWGVVDQLHSSGVSVAEVAPTCRARYICGKGNASKDAVLASAIRRFIDVPIDGNDVGDATILRAMGCDQLGHPIATVPASQRLALRAVAWPAPFALAQEEN